MPNWCVNRLFVTGPDVIPFVVKANPGLPHDIIETLTVGATRGSNEPGNPVELRVNLLHRFRASLDFSGHVPAPVPELEGDDALEWAIAHWGTKWPQEMVAVRVMEPERFEVFFETAWSPPYQWLSSVAQMHPELCFRMVWHEPGMLLWGMLRLGPFGRQRVYEFGDDPEAFRRFSRRWELDIWPPF